MNPLRSVAAFAVAGLVGAFGVAAFATVPAAAKAPVHASASSAVRPPRAAAPVAANASIHASVRSVVRSSHVNVPTVDTSFMIVVACQLA